MRSGTVAGGVEGGYGSVGHFQGSSTAAPPLQLFVNFVDYRARKPSRKLHHAMNSHSNI